MKKHFNLLLLSTLTFILTTISCSSPKEPTPFKVMSFNIDAGRFQDSIYFWDVRKEGVVEIIKREKVQLLGIQEATISQINYLDSVLTGYIRVGVASDNGIENGEFNAIYYDSERFTGIDGNTIWLSETPLKVSKGWDANYNRIMSFAVLKDKETEREFTYFNTQFDKAGAKSRENSAKLVIKAIKEITKDRPAIFSGSLNVTSGDRAVKYLLSQKFLYDTRALAEHRDSLTATMHSYGKTKILGINDYIFFTEGFKVNDHKIIFDKVNDIFISDHNPVVADMIFVDVLY